MSKETNKPNSKGAEAQPAVPPPAEEKEISLDELDNLLAEEDPSFANEFAVIKSEKFDADLEVEDFDSVDAVIASPPALSGHAKANRFSQFIQNRKTNISAAVKGIIPSLAGLISGLFSKSFGSIGAFFRMPAKQKGVVLVVLSLSVLLAVIGVRGLRGSVLPSFELKFLTSFRDVADKSFKTEPGESFEDFDNPLRHPDFVVLIERLVVNLRPSESSSDNPMGMFEFYIESSTQEGAIEINERQKEIRDLMARTLEIATHDQLAGAEGKDKMKLTLRRELNTLLSQGRVRRVFFKTIILKP